jgi:hypothetical protein
MLAFAHVALFAWIVLVPVLFTRMSRQRAVMIAIVAGWLFLPEIRDYAVLADSPPPARLLFISISKINAISYGLLAAVLCFDRQRLLSFRPQWFDAPMIAWCVCPFFTIVANDMRLYVGFSQTWQQTLYWGVPYLMGRLYFTDLAGLRELAIGIVLGGLVYVPFCMFEVRLSPQLHRWVYGFYQHDFGQSVRGSTFRATVFMEHGLMVGMWMTAATVMAVWTWWTGALGRLDVGRWCRPLPMGGVVLLLLIAMVLLKSAGALALGVGAAAALFVSRWLPAPVALVGLLLVPPTYIVGRAWTAREPTGWLASSLDDKASDELERRALEKPMFAGSDVTGDDFLRFLSEVFNPERASSVQTRLVMEDKLLEKAVQHPMFGWGGEGRARVYDPAGKDVSITDGYWIAVLGDRGFFGLVAMCAAVLLPALRFAWVHPQRLWSHPALAPAAVIAVLLAISLIDDLFNAMIDPIFILASGALASVTGTRLPEETPAREAARPVETPAPRLRPQAAETQLPGVLKRRLPSRPE